ncbi:MAG: RNA polymerase sigma factor [Actinomycetota bacterium]
MVALSGNEEDGELYKLAVSGDRDAVEALVARHHQDLVLYLRAKTDARAVVEDAVAETWLRFFRHLKEVAEDPGRALRKPESIRFWLYRTALNALRDQFRRSTRQAEVANRVTGEASARGELVFEADELADLENDDRRVALRAGFAKLSERCRELLTLMLADPPLSYQEIADLLDRPIGSLGPTRQRCLGELRRHMGVVT